MVAFQVRPLPLGAWPGVFAALGNPDYFARVRVDIEADSVVPDGQGMAPQRLYEEARKNPLVAA